MPRIVTGHQPTYLPWPGLFHKISLADVFVFMDDVQYLAQDWNNRNRIRTPQGWQWLTVPVRLKQSASLRLCDIRIDTSRRGTRDDWQARHWRTLEVNYRRAAHFDRYAPWLEECYLRRRWERLAELCEVQLLWLMEQLELAPKFVRASECGFTEKKSALVLEHCQRFAAGICVTGAQGKNYIDHATFAAAGVKVYHQYYRVPEYTQAWPGFEWHLSVLDLLFNHGPAARAIMLNGNVTAADVRALTAEQPA